MARLPLILGLLAGMACDIALSVTGPAAADGNLNVNVQPVRHDIHASCPGFADLLEDDLQHFWTREQLFGDVQVQFVMENGRIGDVKTRGRFGRLNNAVRAAMHRVNCGSQAPTGKHAYRLHVSFIDPDRLSRAEAMARAPTWGVAVAQVKP
ncbi:MAG: hypothetical protein ACT6S0_21785 [Roseateles sp.]|uniref:hypothetical protein n=1 Tax=Roseateles sp. TaxID=1971397 RepID=UPI004035027C